MDAEPSADRVLLVAERHITHKLTDREYLRWRLNMAMRGEPIAPAADAWAQRRRSK